MSCHIAVDKIVTVVCVYALVYMMVMDEKMLLLRRELSYFCITFKIVLSNVVHTYSIPVNSSVLINEKHVCPLQHNHKFYFIVCYTLHPCWFLQMQRLLFLYNDTHKMQIVKYKIKTPDTTS